MRGAIIKFRGQFKFLSNFYRATFVYDGLEWPTSEHAFQAQKTLAPEEREIVRTAETPREAKRLGQQAALRDDWEQIKAKVMADVLAAKFGQSPELMGWLRDTGEMLLVEGTEWCDSYWGVCYCKKCKGIGQNMLGRILMHIRDRS